MLGFILLNVKNAVILLCLLREEQNFKKIGGEAVERPETYRKKREALRKRIYFVGLRDAPHFSLIAFGRPTASPRQIFTRKKHSLYFCDLLQYINYEPVKRI